MREKTFLGKIGKYILDIIFPIYCLGCGLEGKWICAECAKKIKINKKQACPICGRESGTGAVCFNCRNKTDLNGVIAAANYTNKKENDPRFLTKDGGLVKEAIHIFKYRFVKDLAVPLANLIAAQLKNRQLVQKEKSIPFGPDIFEDRIIIPVPLHAKRLRWRGFNQAELLAKKMAERFGFPLEKSALVRVKNNIPQVEIKERRARLLNIRDAFQCLNKESVKDKRVILIDDVCTTAGTMSECAKALKNSGAKEVWGVVIARG